mmetsp:Transcript_22462/g.49231  ORF Transcript_22462/g.49231 Transcript_22462/m.49231 type:complete len:428 (-) Transcript_22462:98-1381(-)|eukprot:CAMPEP_0206433568 /NCGR_PEP_ID=MMETSP0324_2-20121206/8608_1 /ASSEMBLY_ACC=CAM_ASM_000836 /TAXON_ID=2866 /ORGANISM="Crypthecodinium cohnii, Strain Seligo" /LENGTH=427 /DNA_ID=CAMNT_0053899853 /DNA_START=174 /DNA_END=1457 /DNA_ORIENTATION=-
MGAKCCTDRRKKDKNGIYEGPNAPIYMPDPILEERATTKDDEALNIQAQLHGSVGGDGVIIGIIGEKTLQSPTTKARLEAIGAKLAEDFDGEVCFLVCNYGGDTGIQAALAGGAMAVNSYAVYAMQPHGAEPAAGQQVLNAGFDEDHMHQIYLQICDVYITAEGGVMVAEAAMSAAYWGAVIMPLICTGGASSGGFQFPPGNLQHPSCVPEAQWAILSDRLVSESQLAAGVSQILETMIAARSHAIECKAKHGNDLWKVAKKRSLRQRPEKVFDPRKAVSKEEAAEMEDYDFEAVMANWKPKGAKGGGAIRGNYGAPPDNGGPDNTATSGPKPEEEVPSGPPPTTREVAPVKIDAPPPPTLHDEGSDPLDDITEARKRMAARLEEVHVKTSSASTKLQAVFRGRVAREAVSKMKEEMEKQGLAALKD